MMKVAEIRQRFLDYFARHGHAIRPSSSLVPADDPTLLFTNAGMVQFKRLFLGEERPSVPRAVTSQKCLRVSGKHNDLEEVGVTRRHHTFFEMLGNFSFGDYFKRDAIRFAWELMTVEYGLPRERLWATVHYSDDEAAALWQEIAALPPERIFRLGDKDNFWQMGETGPCGPCSELHYDLRAEGERGTDLPVEAFIEQGERGEFLELWNLVFMQFDRAADGTMTPLPAPSIDTGAGLERLAAVLQGVESNYETDLFAPLIARAEEVVGVPYDAVAPSGVSYRVLADHSRAVAFLLADGVFPSNEGRGYVLRRILRRAVRHAWLLGRREPTLVHVVERLIERMGEAYDELRHRRDHILRITEDEEKRFLATIDAGMARFDEIAPPLEAERLSAIRNGDDVAPAVGGEDAFWLHDTHGFPLDLTELIARERGYTVDVEAFERALETQRERSRQDRRAAAGVVQESLAEGWVELDPDAEQEFVGYRELAVDSDVIALRPENGRVALQLRKNPFYAEAGGQVSDEGVVEGDGWRVNVDDVRRVGGRVAVLGNVDGELPSGPTPLAARASVTRPVRHDTMRNHTATHLLHAALRSVLGEHVVQRGSLVAPDRLRFDFAQPRPLTPAELHAVEERVNLAILEDHDVRTEQTTYPDAVVRGAMALFGERYGDVVRMVIVPGVSIELCAGTHVRHTGEIGLFRIVGESGIAAGIRRIEAMTGTAAWRRTVEREALLERAAETARTAPETLPSRVDQLNAENRDLRRQLERAHASGSADVITQLIDGATSVDAARVIAREIEAENANELRLLGDRLRERLRSGAAILAARQKGRVVLLAIVTDDLLSRGVRADRLVREVAALAGGTGGGRAHMAQGGASDPSQVPGALDRAPDIVRSMLAQNA